MHARTIAALILFVWGGIAAGIELTPRSTEWKLPKGAAKWVENGTILQIDADQPHHTSVDLLNAAGMPDFMLTLRVRIVSWEGAAPGLYFYMRREGGGLEAASLGRDGLRLMGWYGRGEPGTSSAKGGVPPEKGVWLHLKMVTRGNYCVAKVWRDGALEPRWQVEHRYSRLKGGALGVGVWTHPNTPSKASVQFSDVHAVPVTEQLLKEQNVLTAPAPSLEQRQIPAAWGCFKTNGMVGIRGTRLAVAFDIRDGCPTTLLDLVSGQEFSTSVPIWALFHLSLR
ncbi:MAG: hypothetical protein KAI66_01430, partial [Lentisphaeria bacterium]|nr:hypothetical protein [Lentisphaeria bacterium]